MLITSVIAAIALMGCCTIKVPPAKETGDKEFTSKLKADIAELKANGALEVTYKNKIDVTYATLNDDHLGLLMWLRAARCESRAGHKELASKLYDYALKAYMDRNPNSGVNIMSLGASSVAPPMSNLPPGAAAAVAKQILQTWESINK